MTNSEGQTPRRGPAWWLGFLLGAALIGVTLHVAVGLALRFTIWAGALGAWSLAAATLLGWRTALLLGLSLLLALGWDRLPGFPGLRSFRRHARAWGLALLAGGLLLGGQIAFKIIKTQNVNRFGFQVFALGHEGPIDVDHPRRPASYAHINRDGYRDGEWGAAPEQGVLRVAVVGDSNVLGHGVVDEADLFDRQLELALSELAPTRRWEVLNMGMSGYGLTGYYDTARVAIEALGARAIVIQDMGTADLVPLDRQGVFELFGGGLYEAMCVLGVVEALEWDAMSWMNHVSRWAPGFVGEARLIRRLRRLVDAAAAVDAVLVEWTRDCDFEAILRRYASEDDLEVVSWPPERCATWEEQSSEPLVIPMDAHFTAAGHNVIARLVAPRLLRRLGLEGE